MTTWIILLRGVNVSGQKKLVMAELRMLLAENGFTAVQTYIQSGNIILETEHSDQEAIERQISDLIKLAFGFAVEVFARTPERLRTAVLNNPFLKDPNVDLKQLYLTFLNQPPSEENTGRLEAIETPGDDYVLNNMVLYIRYSNGAGKAKLTNNLIENKLQVSATSRNWNTVNKLLELSS